MTAAKLAANRANAQASTGPRTDAGKAASSANSTRHGLSSERLIMPGEDPAAYAALRETFLRDLKPATGLEHTLAEKVAETHWRLQRVYRLETSFFANRIDAITAENPQQAPDDALAQLFIDPKEMARMRLFLRYLGAAERAYNKALADFRTAQTERRKRQREDALAESWLASQTAPQPEPTVANTEAPATDGFVPYAASAAMSANTDSASCLLTPASLGRPAPRLPESR